MCTIIVCPEGSSKNSDFLFKALRISGLTNTDGAGFTFKRRTTKKVFISKGYTSTQDLIDAILKHKLKDSDELVIHQRIGNKGAKNTDMCHPFVVSENKEEILKNHKYVDKPTMVHNGTFHTFSKHNSDFSDTYWFIKEMMYQKDLINMLKTDLKFFEELLSAKLGTNRLCFLFPNEETNLIKLGLWKEDNGYFFSNESYKNRNIRNVGGVEESVYSGSENERYDAYWDDKYPARSVNHIITSSSVMKIVNNEEKKHYKKSSITHGDLVITKGLAFDHPITGITYRNFLGMWVPDKYDSVQQFYSIKFEPNLFNYKDFVYVSEYSDVDLGIEKGVLYDIVSFHDANSSITIRRRIQCSHRMNDLIYLDTNLFVKIFRTTPKDTDSFNKINGFYKLSKSFQPSKNIRKKVGKILDVSNFKKKKNTNFKGVEYKTHSALALYYNVLTKNLFPKTYKEELNKQNVVIFD